MSDAVLVAIRIKASPARCFKAFTEEIAQWWRADPFFAFTPRSPGVLAFEPGEGGRLVEHLPSGKSFEIGRILVWAPPEKLVFSWRQATFAPEMSTVVEVVFEALGEGETRVSVTHRGWARVPDGHVARHGHDGLGFAKRHALWWRRLLESFRAAAAA